MSMDEQLLIAQILDDPEAFRHLYRLYHPRLFAYIAYRVGRAEDAEDLTAEVFMRVVKGIKRFCYQGEGSVAAWLFQIAHNEVARFHGRRRADSIPLEDLPDIESDTPGLESILQRKEQFARVRQAITALSPRRQEIVTLKFFGGLNNREIAQVLDLDERTVASHLSRALDNLHEILQWETRL
jgi:RNA polymerase sigma-70 factor (ECF subfamily)